MEEVKNEDYEQMADTQDLSGALSTAIAVVEEKEDTPPAFDIDRVAKDINKAFQQQYIIIQII